MANQYQPKNINYSGIVPDPFIIPGDLIVNGTSQLNGATIIDDTLAVTGASTFTTITTSGLATLQSALVTTTLATGGLATLNSAAITNNTTVGGTLVVTSGITGARLSETATTTVPADTAYAILVTDRYLFISTTGAGTFTLTLGNLGSTIFKVTILMTAFNTGTYIATTPQGTITWGAANDVATLVHLGSGLWAVENATKTISPNPNLVSSSFLAPSMVPADLPEFYVPSIIVGRIARITGTLQGALNTGNTVVTFQINGVPVTNGVLTFIEAGSAAGDTYSVDPTALNSVNVGARVRGVLSGTNNAAVSCAFTVTYSY